MTFKVPTQETAVKNITVATEPKILKNKKNKDYIWVNESAEVGTQGWYCDIPVLFDRFHKGSTVQCLVTMGDFKSIVDVVSDTPVAEKSRGEKHESVIFQNKAEDPVIARLDKIGKLVAEMHDLLFQSEERPEIK